MPNYYVFPPAFGNLNVVNQLDNLGAGATEEYHFDFKNIIGWQGVIIANNATISSTSFTDNSTLTISNITSYKNILTAQISGGSNGTSYALTFTVPTSNQTFVVPAQLAVNPTLPIFQNSIANTTVVGATYDVVVINAAGSVQAGYVGTDNNLTITIDASMGNVVSFDYVTNTVDSAVANLAIALMDQISTLNISEISNGVSISYLNNALQNVSSQISAVANIALFANNASHANSSTTANVATFANVAGSLSTPIVFPVTSVQGYTGNVILSANDIDNILGFNPGTSNVVLNSITIANALGYTPISNAVLQSGLASITSVNSATHANVAATANALTNPITISLIGNATGSVTFTGNSNVSITTSIVFPQFPSSVANSSYANTSGTVVNLTGSQVTNAIGYIPVNNASLAVANGVATLDNTGHLLTAQVPPSLIGALNYQGTWDAFTNTPTLANSTGTKGWFYTVANAGSTTLNGLSTWNLGDWAVFSGLVWQKLDGVASEVISVAGRTGVVTLSTSDISGLGTYATQTFVTSSITNSVANLVSNSTLTTTLGTYATQNFVSNSIGNAVANLVSNSTLTTTLGNYATQNYVNNTFLPLTGGTMVNANVELQSSLIQLDASSQILTGANIQFTDHQNGLPELLMVNIAGSALWSIGTNQLIDGSNISNSNLYVRNLNGSNAIVVHQNLVVSFSNSITTVTQPNSDNSTNVATTAFVKAQNYLSSVTYPVTSVAGRTGAITLSISDISGIGGANVATANYANTSGFSTTAGSANSAIVANTVNTITTSQIVSALGFNPGTSNATNSVTVTLTGAMTGQASGNSISINTTLANSGVTAGTYGSASYVPQIVVNSAGIVTSISNIAVAGGGGGGSSTFPTNINVTNTVQITAASNVSTEIQWQNGTNNLWQLGTSGNQTGSDQGANFVLTSFHDNGVVNLSNVATFYRANGNVIIGNTVNSNILLANSSITAGYNSGNGSLFSSMNSSGGLTLSNPSGVSLTLTCMPTGLNGGTSSATINMNAPNNSGSSGQAVINGNRVWDGNQYASWQIILSDSSPNNYNIAQSNFKLGCCTSGGSINNYPLIIFGANGIATWQNSVYFQSGIVANGASNTTTRVMTYQSNGVSRFVVGLSNTAEAAGNTNVGSNYVIQSYSDNAATVVNTVTIYRSNGLAAFANTITTVTQQNGDNTTNVATTAYVQNTNGIVGTFSPATNGTFSITSNINMAVVTPATPSVSNVTLSLATPTNVSTTEVYYLTVLGTANTVSINNYIGNTIYNAGISPITNATTGLNWIVGQGYSLELTWVQAIGSWVMVHQTNNT